MLTFGELCVSEVKKKSSYIEKGEEEYIVGIKLVKVKIQSRWKRQKAKIQLSNQKYSTLAKLSFRWR